MTNREKFIRKVLEIVNKKHKTNFAPVKKELPEEIFIIEYCINGKNFIHGFDAEVSTLTYKTIKEYAKALIEIVKEDLIQAKK